MTDWESQFRAWSAPPSPTEEEKCARAVRMVENAVRSDPALAGRALRVFAQGSYRNRTNVPRESDVDVCILCTDAFFYDFTFSPELNPHDLGFSSAPYQYPTFKNEVESALEDYFGADHVVRGNKAFDIHETSSRVDADVVACFEHRQYQGDRQDYSYLSGTGFLADSGSKIVNWPEQQHENGTQKNDQTNRRFRKITRVLKSLRYQMEDEGGPTSTPIPSFLVECLVWNVPDSYFATPTLTENLRSALEFTATNTANGGCRDWAEVSDLKYLFRNGQPWTVEGALQFLTAAGHHVGFW